MTSVTLLLLIGIVTVKGSSLTLSCGVNEILTCGPYCVETCDYKPYRCTKDCQWDCFCQEGYIRESNETDSVCIKYEDCSKKSEFIQCNENAEYQECGSSCARTCDDLKYPISKGSQKCSTMCQPGCFCKQGYYRTKDGQCVTAEHCCTGDNEQYTKCGSACVETCDNEPKQCIDLCVAGCFCMSNDYVRQNNQTDSICLKRTECPK